MATRSRFTVHVTVAGGDGSVVAALADPTHMKQDRVQYVVRDGVGTIREFVRAEEGVTWCREWWGPAVDALKAAVALAAPERTTRMHTATGRWSSLEPNFQNIPRGPRR